MDTIFTTNFLVLLIQQLAKTNKNYNNLIEVTLNNKPCKYIDLHTGE